MEHFSKTYGVYSDYKETFSSVTSTIPPTKQNDTIDFSDEFGLNQLTIEYSFKLLPVFEAEYNELIANHDFFWGCSLAVYERDFDKRKDLFQLRYPDASQIDFIIKEADNLCNPYPPFYDLIYNPDLDIFKNIQYSLERKKELLVDEAKKYGYELEFLFDHEHNIVYPDLYRKNSKTEIAKQVNKPKTNSLKWSGTDLELYELVKSLIESKKTVGSSQKAIFETLFKVFEIDYSDARKKDAIATIRGRVKDKTPFLDELQIGLNSWIKAKDEDKINQ